MSCPTLQRRSPRAACIRSRGTLRCVISAFCVRAAPSAWCRSAPDCLRKPYPGYPACSFIREGSRLLSCDKDQCDFEHRCAQRLALGVVLLRTASGSHIPDIPLVASSARVAAFYLVGTTLDVAASAFGSIRSGFRPLILLAVCLRDRSCHALIDAPLHLFS